MNRRQTTLISVFLAMALASSAHAQIETVPMKGLGNEWVKKLELRGRSDWEWLETYPEQVYFASRVDSERNGDIVTMWLRIEYKNPQSPGAHKSAASRDDWDCAKRRRSTLGLIFYKWNNLQADEPVRSTNLLRYWEKIEAGSIGETLLGFACSIKAVQPLITPATPASS
jgi:hypothetical protein